MSTGVDYPGLLSDLGLTHLHGGKLTLSSVLEINGNTLSDQPPQGLRDLPWTFLRKLMMANLNARNIKCAHKDDKDDDDDSAAVNPLDLITALFHCSDPFLQQEMVSKMALCQFAVPLLLPACDSQKSTLMLWALRNVVKKYRPHSLAGEKTFVEGRVVEMDIPMVSFVRLGESKLPKSQILNKLLSNPHQHNDTFIHYDMECGDVPRRISDGLVEISWYLPSGNPNIDMFAQAVAIANLRGDCRLFKAQVSFLCQTSAAVFIFSDGLEDADLSTLFNGRTKSSVSVPLFLVTKSHSKTLREECRAYGISEKNVVIKKKMNDSEFVKILQACVKGVLEGKPDRMKLIDMATDMDAQNGIEVDEECKDCSKGKQNAEGISETIHNIVKFKQDQLPLHGKIWKEISQLEKENCRLRNADKDIEHYQSSLKIKEGKLREEQQQMADSETIAKFISGISEPGIQRLYFLRWLKIHLDTISRHDLSDLRQRYKECCRKTPQDKKNISLLDEEISNCSLGPEHFFRELGQLYECACSLPENDPARQQVQHLPALCAQMLLDGCPVELVDGDASNIPMKWIKEVLTRLHSLVSSESKILVLTVLGVQSTGKSTLLNTMFGVQFAVSSGRCTRGAFMLLIKVSEELRNELQCDFLMIIDTEGLKSPELAALDTSYEHDNELATLVIGLSDITIINIAMENNTEMKDILQIVVHAFLRMKEVGKRPRCLFVHQNVSDMSAHDSNMRDRKKLIEQLDEMTRAAANMEKKPDYKKFSDVMEYDPEKDSYYIPGLWHGTPPMAPVNAGYSEAVYELKKSLIGTLKDTADAKRTDALGFLKWTNGLWEAVKYEKFIFSFRNSLVADAYTKLCTEYNKWEWSLQREMHSWLLAKETLISNFGMSGSDNQMASLSNYVQGMICEASEILDGEERKIHVNIEEYFKSKDSGVAFVAKYKEDFKASASCLRRETDASLKTSLLKAVDIKEGLEKVNKITSSQKEKIEEQVQALVESCWSRMVTNDLLNVEFEKMWEKLVSELSIFKLTGHNVKEEAFDELKSDFQRKGKSGKVNQNLTMKHFKETGQNTFVVSSKWITFWQKAEGFLRETDSSICQKKLQDLCNSIITDCDILVTDKVTRDKNYHKTHIKEVLERINDKLTESPKEISVCEDCECELKFHICWKAAIRFQKMHDIFIKDNDPKKRLEESKGKFLAEFIDLFHERDQCLKKAEEFTKECLTPAVEDYITKRLGANIADGMMLGDGGVDYSTRTHFEFALLKRLLEEDNFEKFKQYTHEYKTFVNSWILDRIIVTFSVDNKWQELNLTLLSDVVKKIKGAIKNASKESRENTDMKSFTLKICSYLCSELIFQENTVFIMSKEVNTDQFTENIMDALSEMEQSLNEKYSCPVSQDDLREAIKRLPVKPHDWLFTTLCGCGEQCPFCGTPCEAGGKDHKTHFSKMHRPKGLGHFRWNDSQKLVTDICTTAVISNTRFKDNKTKGEWHPYKDYRKIYPDWEITGDSTMEASDYWKYVFMKYNQEFSMRYYALPADIPDAWKKLTKKHARKGLQESFHMGDPISEP